MKTPLTLDEIHKKSDALKKRMTPDLEHIVDSFESIVYGLLKKGYLARLLNHEPSAEAWLAECTECREEITVPTGVILGYLVCSHNFWQESTLFDSDADTVDLMLTSIAAHWLTPHEPMLDLDLVKALPKNDQAKLLKHPEKEVRLQVIKALGIKKTLTR